MVTVVGKNRSARILPPIHPRSSSQTNHPSLSTATTILSTIATTHVRWRSPTGPRGVTRLSHPNALHANHPNHALSPHFPHCSIFSGMSSSLVFPRWYPASPEVCRLLRSVRSGRTAILDRGIGKGRDGSCGACFGTRPVRRRRRRSRLCSSIPRGIGGRRIGVD